MSGDNYIDGQWVVGEGDRFESLNPATGSVIWHGSQASPSQVDEAVAAARKAGKAWASLTFEQRLSYMKAFRHLLETSKESLAILLSQDTGKPHWESMTEISAMISKVAVSVMAYHQRSGTQLSESMGVESLVRHRPHGVMVVIGPFNFPGHLPNAYIIPALLAGNTVVLKPSEWTPALSEKIMHLWHKAELPAGVINMVQGGATIGDALVQNQDINGLLFTGSYRTGASIHTKLAGRPHVLLALEMGGNNPLVIDQVDNVDAAVYLTLQSAYITSGQRCTCARRLIVVNSEYSESYVARLIQAVQNLRVGVYESKPEPFMGSVISEQAAQQVLGFQERLVQGGGVCLVESKQLKPATGLLSPGLVDVTKHPDVPDEECFGPLLQISFVDSLAEAIDASNRTRYGLSAGILTSSQMAFREYYANVHAGIINWNRPTTGAASNAPFGGIGDSGNHRPAAYYAADFCAYPVASQYTPELVLPDKLLSGVEL